MTLKAKQNTAWSVLRLLSYYFTGPLRIHRLERRLHRLELDHSDQQRRFALTTAFYERRIEQIIAVHAREAHTPGPDVRDA